MALVHWSLVKCLPPAVTVGEDELLLETVSACFVGGRDGVVDISLTEQVRSRRDRGGDGEGITHVVHVQMQVEP